MTDPLTILKKDWKAQPSGPTASLNLDATQLSRLRKRVAQFELQEGGSLNRNLAMIMGLLGGGAFGFGWFQQKIMLWMIGAMLLVNSSFQIFRFYWSRRFPLVPSQNLRQYLQHSLERIQWAYRGRILAILSAMFFLGLGWANDDRFPGKLSPTFWVGIVSFLMLAVCIMGVIYWYQKKYLYHLPRLKQELKALITELDQ